MTAAPDSDDSTVFRDLTLLALLGFVTIVALLLPHLHPPTEGEDIAKPAGNLIVEARWPDDIDADIDLWVRAPGDRSVGYSAKSGTVFDLLRDDLGSERDPAGLNYEFAFSRGAPDGDYIVNVHLYSSRAPGPVPVRIVISTVAGGQTSVLAVRDVTLHGVGTETTVARWTLADGALVPGSIHDTPMRLRP